MTLGRNTEGSGGVSNGNSFGMEPVLVQGFPLMSEKLGLIEVSDVKSKKSASTVKGNGSEFDSFYMEAESLESSVVSGFQLATTAGPLCDEPMWGLAFLVEAYIYPVRNESPYGSDFAGENGVHLPEQYGQFSAQVMTVVKEACRSAMLLKRSRLVEALYFCEVSTPTEHLGAMYAVVARRRARIMKEEMQEGSAVFTVHAHVPVVESFGFADELRRWTLGAASPQLLLSHWEAYISLVRNKSPDGSDFAGENGVQLAEQYGPFSGQVMTVVKEACMCAMLLKRPRLVEALHFCEVSTPTEHLGAMYAMSLGDGHQEQQVLSFFSAIGK
eukprot:Gb_27484 [translate_table: standard]